MNGKGGTEMEPDKRIERMTVKVMECQRCHVKSADMIRYHQGTKYVDDDSNWATLCPECRTENDEYWAEMWDRYYSGRL